MVNEMWTNFYIFIIVSYFVRQANPIGEQMWMRGTFAPKVVFCSPLVNKIGIISKQFIFLVFFVRHTGACATILWMESVAYPHFRFLFVFCCLFVNWLPRLNGERNADNFLYLCNSVIFSSPGRPNGQKKIRMRGTSTRSCFLFATMIFEQFIFRAFFVRHTGAWATILRVESEAYRPLAHFRFFVCFFCRLTD